MSRVVIIQPALPTYRVKLFEEMARKVPLLLVYSGSSPEGVVSAEAKLACGMSVVDEVSLFGKIFWQRDVLRIVARERISTLVIGGNPRYLSSVLALIIAKIRRVPVVIWGHSVSSTSRAVGSIIRMNLLRLADRILLYYTEEIPRLPDSLRSRAVGVDNSIDTRRIAEAAQHISDEDVKSHVAGHGLDDVPLLVTIGRITPKANVALLVRSLAKARSRGCEAKLAVIGTGPEQSALEALADELGIGDSVIWVGEVYDEKEIAVWMKSASAFVYAGAVGLSLIHAFAYGLPAIISSDMNDHNPEALLFRDGECGATFRRDDADSLADTICRQLADPEALRAQGARAHEIAHQRLGVERMASRFLSVLDHRDRSETA